MSAPGDPRSPRSLDDRDYNSFATDGTKRGVARKVVDRDGKPIAADIVSLLAAVVVELRAIRRGLEYLSDEDLFDSDDEDLETIDAQ